MIAVLKKMFEANPGKSTITLKGECINCGCKVIIGITITSGGFGLMGGALFKCAPDKYIRKCHDCYQS